MTTMSTGTGSIIDYLKTIRRVVFPDSDSGKSSHSPNDNITVVLGNPSVDLDSAYSAVVTSWFLNQAAVRKSSSSSSGNVQDERLAADQIFVPLLNMPDTRSTELWRLRPEHGAALRLALGLKVPKEDVHENDKSLLNQLITIADIKDDQNSTLHPLFVSNTQTPAQKHPLILVDHNSPVIEGLSDTDISSRFEVIGCIDHHVDEQYVSANAQPRIIRTGIGSCASLVVKYLHENSLWPGLDDKPGQNEILIQLAKLAFAPILIDTSNLKAKGDKCSDTDREAAKFLDSQICKSDESGMSTTSESYWDRDSFYSTIEETKQNSLQLLTPVEMFDRDYKQWADKNKQSGKNINIGIASLVQPLGWVATQAGKQAESNSASSNDIDPSKAVDLLVQDIVKFVEANSLGLFMLLARAGDGRKEIIAISFSDEATSAIEIFGKEGIDVFKFEDWNSHAQNNVSNGDNNDDDDKNMKNAIINGFSNKFGMGSVTVDGKPVSNSNGTSEKNKCAWRVWYQTDMSKSRKQVAPMIRDAVKHATIDSKS